ncbi:hypothetical protein EHS25_000963 [Saitozyma podzolica]|uniref:BZIP domain-containing protein n=1 Tax=Saitozyma podzolica TaxID=1890683 RepID=A0A427YXR2_9TREE|nr:hypothetical protein EHS25_000963 [Saitozyma podzolica]
MVRASTVEERLQLTRWLIIQREYRARKAAKIKNLEESNARLSTENVALMAEIANLKWSDVSFMASSGNSITDFMSSMPSTSAPAPPAVPVFRPKLLLRPLRLLYPPHVRHEIGTTLSKPRRSSDYAPPSLQNGTMLPMPTPQTEPSES